MRILNSFRLCCADGGRSRAHWPEQASRSTVGAGVGAATAGAQAQPQRHRRQNVTNEYQQRSIPRLQPRAATHTAVRRRWTRWFTRSIHAM